jgi:hypothetical protein
MRRFAITGSLGVDSAASTPWSAPESPVLVPLGA